jgi:LPS-assembly lipoprotein
MWLLDLSRGRPTRLLSPLAALGAALLLGGCFQPLYGGPAGSNLKASLAAIEIDPIPDRIGHYVRNELAFDLDGSGIAAPKQYRLSIKVKEKVASPVVDTVAGRAQAGTVTAEATYVLKSLAGDTLVTEGTAVAFASYDRTTQRFASVRAARDAEIRIANQLAEQIRTRIAAVLASRR